MPGVQTVTRTLGHQCMGLLDKLSEYICKNGETARTQLATLGRYENEAGFSAGLFRSGFNEAFVAKKVELQDDTGKVQAIVLSYLQRATPSDVTQAATDLDGLGGCDPCTHTTTQDYNEVQINETDMQEFCYKISFSRREWIQRCEDPDEGMMRRILA